MENDKPSLPSELIKERFKQIVKDRGYWFAKNDWFAEQMESPQKIFYQALFEYLDHKLGNLEDHTEIFYRMAAIEEELHDIKLELSEFRNN
jgi:hypothetical protein